jgi:hypothetical protein
MPTAGSFGSKRAAAITVSATGTLKVEVEDAVYRRIDVQIFRHCNDPVFGDRHRRGVWTAFDRRIAELGHQEGRNLATEYIQAENVEGFEFGYRELAKRQVDIVVASGPEIALKSALAATTTSPIVMIAIDYDPLARGYVTNLARPCFCGRW